MLTEPKGKSPEFFIKLLCSSYLPDNEDRETLPAPTPEHQKIAIQSWQILHEWRELPGLEQTEWNPIILNEWFTKTHKLAKEASREEIFLIIFGEALGRSSLKDEKDRWPHKTLRDFIEINHNQTIEQGIHTGFTNNIFGGKTIWIEEKKKIENALKDDITSWAQSFIFESPRTAALLMKFASSLSRNTFFLKLNIDI